MLKLFNHIIATAPAFEDDDLVGFPISAILNWPMGTPTGLAMFTDPRVNQQLRQMFYVWSSFLTSPDSRYVLMNKDNGWFGQKASEKILNFVDTFICNPTSGKTPNAK